ncbi:hypothetical protein N311_00441, partial [Apaloderma vittatum]
FDEKCKDEVTLEWTASFVTLAFFVPGGAAAHNYNQLKRLACWSLKEFNITSHIISELLTDVDSIRHAVLQNRAAIDFLLLAQGHGCEEFDGMCCMNLSDHLQSIHKQLSDLQQQFNKISYNTDPFSEWLNSLNLRPWLTALIKWVM